jgi:transcriptional regulator with XRE-family HTH domain
VKRTSGKADDDKQLAKIGDAIRLLRTAKSVSQEDLADIADMDRSHLGRIERGERNVTALNLIKISKALGVKASEVLNLAGL